MNKINFVFLLYINSVLSFNLYSIIYPIKHSFNIIDKKWNYENRLFPTNKKSTYIGKWYYYNNIDLIKNEKNIIDNPKYWINKTVLTDYEYDNNKIIISKILNHNYDIKNLEWYQQPDK